MVDTLGRMRTVSPMSEQDESATDASEEAEVTEGAPSESAAQDDDPASQDPVDQLGIPMSREVTLDDVRTDGDAHRRLALGCSLVVIVAVICFWVFRVALAG